MNPLNFVLPPGTLFWLKVLSYVVVFAAGAYTANYINTYNDMKEEIVEQKATIKMEQEQAKVSIVVAVKGQAKKKQIAGVFHERERMLAKPVEETPSDFQPTQESKNGNDDARGGRGAGSDGAGDKGLTLIRALRVPVRTVCLWDSANAGELPPPGCLDNAAPSDVDIRAVERQHDREAALTHSLEAQVNELQAWICAQYLLHTGERAPFEVCQ